MPSFQRRGVSLALLSTTVLTAVVLLLAVSLFFVIDLVLQSRIREDLRREATTLAESTATTISKLLWNFDDEGIKTLGDEVSRNPLVLSFEVKDDRDTTLYRAQKPGRPFERLKVPVYYQLRWTGSIDLVSSEDEVRARTLALEAPATLAGGLLLLLMLAVTPLVMGGTVLRPFQRLGRRLEAVDPRLLSDDVLVSSSRIREVQAVETALRTLASAVRENVRTLEERVEDRTEALRATQMRLAHAEALAAAGRVAAGVSHELNTPLAAVLSSARTLRAELFQGLAARLAGPGEPEFHHLLDRALTLAPLLDARHDRQARAELREPWIASGRDPETTLFDLLGTAALRPLAQELLTWSPGGWREQGLYQVLVLGRFLGIIEESAEKGARVVQALSGQLDRPDDEASSWFDATLALERCLVLHESRGGHGVDVRRSFPPDLKFYGPEGRLGQVWLSLVANAFQAVGTQGWVELGARRTLGEAEVWVADSGPRVPPESRSRLFEPYFSTKSGGLGLGLALSHSIVEALGGHLNYEETETRKAFVVRWPQPTN